MGLFAVNNDIDVLLLTLSKFEVDKKYSLFEEEEGAICLDYLNDTWVTYYSAKGLKLNAKEYNSFYEACTGIFKFLSDNKKEAKAMAKYFQVLKIQLADVGYELESAEEALQSDRKVGISNRKEITR